MAVHPLTPGVWYSDFVQEGDRPALGLAAGSRHSILIDGGNGQAQVQELLDFAAAQDIPSLKALCLTHWHWDHVFGAAHTGLPVVACRGTQEKVAWMATLSWTNADLDHRVAQGTELPFCREHIRIEYPEDDRVITIAPVDLIFNRALTLDLGGLTARLFLVDCDHVPDSVVVHLVEPGVVFLGDCLYANLDREPWYRTRHRTLALLDALAQLGANWYIPSHHPLYTREEFLAYVAGEHRLAALVGESTTRQQVERRFQDQAGRLPTEDEWDSMLDYLHGNQRQSC